ncbi:MAG: DUF3791 domain-containing protein [Treponema sp.]|nr:DUF3791 domain-containing protein [Treponema sp.]
MEKRDLRRAEFVVYCIETYKDKKNLDGKTAYQKLKNSGAIEYIDENYDALHTFGDDGIVWNIDEYLLAVSGD